MTTDRVPAARFPRQTFAELSTALGVHRNSCTAWSAAGAPAGPPYCELAWRTWAASQGRACPTPPEQALLELLAGAGIPEYRRQLDAQRVAAAGGPGSGVGSAGGSGSGALVVTKDWDQENKRLQAEQRQMDIDKARRRLISVDDLHVLIEAIGRLGASVLNDAPRLVDTLPLGPDDRQRCMAAIEAELAKRRAVLVEQLRARLLEFLQERA